MLLGNTICDSYFNNELCDWDGGDCCTQFTDLDKCGPGDHCTCHLTGKLHKTLKSGNNLANSTLQILTGTYSATVWFFFEISMQKSCKNYR